MKKIKKSKVIYMGIIFFIVLLVFVIKKINVPHSVVMPALSKTHAEGMIKENECYIVRVASPDEFGTGGWYYINGKEKIKMLLGGRNPAYELSYLFLEHNMNSFLVKGKVDEERTQSNECLTFDVESWYFIAPIKREYGNREYREEQRFFYPKDYLDIYDLEQGDYTPLESQK